MPDHSTIPHRQPLIKPLRPLTQRSNALVPANTDAHFNVLIVDDEPINLQVLQNHLSLKNYHIT